MEHTGMEIQVRATHIKQGMIKTLASNGHVKFIHGRNVAHEPMLNKQADYYDQRPYIYNKDPNTKLLSERQNITMGTMAYINPEGIIITDFH